MIVVVCTLLGVLSALTSARRVRRLAELRLIRLELVWVAFLGQIVVFEGLARFIPHWTSALAHYMSYALCIAFIVANRHLPGNWIIALGTSTNLAAIAANGGTMPANEDAWRRAGLRPIAADAFENSSALANPRLGFLGDVFAIPEAWPLSNVFSIGDVLIVIGGTYLAHRWCSQPPVPTERLELSLTAP